MRTTRKMRLSPFLLAICWAVAASGQAPGGPTISLVEGRGHLLTFPADITKVAVAEPKIADAVVISPREVMVNAKGPGHTTVVVWEGEADPTQYDVDVSKDSSDWEAFRKQLVDSAGGSPVTVTGSGTGDTIVLSGSVKSADDAKRLTSMAQTRAKNVINLLQAPPAPLPRQILLQVKFAAINRVALSQIGFNLFSLNNKFQGETSTQGFTQPLFSPIANGVTNSVNFSNLLNLFAFRPDLNIGATVEALEQHNLLQILAEPNLITLDGKTATFLSGGSFPYPIIATTPTGGATAPVITVQFKPYGIKLDFTPTSTPQGEIDLQVAPEVSSLDYTNAVTLEGYTIPALSERRAETEVVLKDGESFAIAGLISNNIVDIMEKIPALGDIPILGKLFRSRSQQKSSDELLVLITPHFVRPLPPGEKAKMLDMPETFLPTLNEERSKKGKHKGNPPGPGDTPPAGTAADQPQFVGPRGQQIPK